MSSKAKKAGEATKKGVTKSKAQVASAKAGPAKASSSAKPGVSKSTTSKPKAAKAGSAAKPKRVSALDAAAQVLKAAGKPMRSGELIQMMSDKGLWTSPGGKTPEATLYAAMMREARDKKAESRFKKIDRGQFAFNG
ncbi:MAG: hypothetical protein HRU71_12825 [Planctomycetia bacterium]|nr:MAG: hypothetical protein HRU71_12825 [Planctomycetia bacterium]